MEILKELKKTRTRKELEDFLVQLEKEFKQTKKLLKEDQKGFNKRIKNWQAKKGYLKIKK